MAEAFLNSLDAKLQVFSAGTKPASQVHPITVAVMKELKIDLNTSSPKSVDQFLHEAFDYVITVCDDAKETCPVFLGKVKHRVHMGFDDPAAAAGTDAEIMDVFRRVRDEIRERFFTFYSEQIKPTLKT